MAVVLYALSSRVASGHIAQFQHFIMCLHFVTSGGNGSLLSEAPRMLLIVYCLLPIYAAACFLCYLSNS